LASDVLKEIEQRKSLHFNITSAAHAALRINCFKRGITMQDFFEEVSQLVEAESPIIISVMENTASKKKNKKIKKLTETDAESLYNMIEKEISEGSS
jgi:hypothetical protein